MTSSPPAHVPYQAYKSKRHSRTISNQYLVPNVSPPPTSRLTSTNNNGSPRGGQITAPSREISPEPEKLDLGPPIQSIISVKLEKDSIPKFVHSNGGSPQDTAPTPDIIPSPEPSSPAASVDTHTTEDVVAPSPVCTTVSTLVNGKTKPNAEPIAGPSSSSASATPSDPTVNSRKLSTFRHIPLRTPARSPMPSSPLRPSRTPSSSSATSRHLEPSQALRPSEPRARMLSHTSQNLEMPHDRPLPTIPSVEHLTNDPPIHEKSQSVDSHISPEPYIPPPRTHSLMAPSRPPTQSSSPSPTPSPSMPGTPAPYVPSHPPTPVQRPSAPYRPGFQPKGVYRIRTDEFTEVRTAKRDVGRVERTKLERRLEKLINLHFSTDEKRAIELGRPPANKRASSLFDFDISGLKSIDAGELWRGVMSPALQGSKGDVRAAEQRITPWEDDASATKCPLCSASFHPLTNRKHHCRLCGNIICSLPVKRPQRPVPCSLLFVVDPLTRRIEEVDEGVDYGVRKRRSTASPSGKGKEKEETLGDDEKFLKGVRICRECRPVLLRQQYQQDVTHVPIFTRLYETFTGLEKEIEDSLPQFQELLLTLSHDDQPTKEASAARKRLLDAFAQYDALSKRIRKLPCPGGPGSSQDRMQVAILTRANLFLQKNMFPLQSLPKPKSKATMKSASQEEAPLIDPDSELALALQPLLEQEALLESFVEEAKAHRKFEDAKTLKANLVEIRTEIDKIVVNAEGGMTRGSARK